MKRFVAGALALAVVASVAAGTIAYSQQSTGPKPGPAQTGGQLPGQAQAPGQAPGQAPSCLTQYTPMPGQSAITMIRAGYEIKAAVPNGLWLQKDKDVYYCNSGRPIEGDAQCWQMREVTRC
ncbi:MAG: hypothetical protein EPO10_06505 [Reyranella sp.]|uniref:hypothetical protein n=1 Tax=Reyranella sp. TaxID=1929291 RepID=UPI00120F0D3D|nr:hypothetical protein [Reyranella sp.]TAJ97103.1 MAG: hypothetical protein EPO41_03670 [Reyranella sp.]TBR29719.1 MAG: hypothetical protein EPO10_06505 [Reyranella sp.]